MPGTDEQLLDRYANGDVAARDEIARRYMPMARRLARGFRRSHSPTEDMEQVAYLGLLKSIDRFDAERGSFVGYAITTIRGELRRHLRDHGWMLHVTRPLQERYLKVCAAADKATAKLGRTPTIAEIAEQAGMTVDDVVEGFDAAHGYAARSLDVPVGPDGEDSSLTLGDTLGEEDRRYEYVELRETVAPAFNALPERDQRILRMRFVEDLTQSEIAARCGVSQMQISRLLRRSLNELSEAAELAATP